MRKSVSRVGKYKNCPYQYKLHYIDGLKALPDQEADNALYLGTAIHEAFESGEVMKAIESYQSNYYALTTDHYSEEIKLLHLIPKVLEILPPGECEVKIETDEFVGYIDRLEHLFDDNNGIKHYTIWDYKYSNNIDHYMESPQLHVYKHFYELTHPNTVVDELKYVFVPKTRIRQKKTETIQQFRQRLIDTLAGLEIQVVPIKFNQDMVTQFLEDCQLLDTVTEFPKNPSNLCRFCEHAPFCQKGETWIYND